MKEFLHHLFLAHMVIACGWPFAVIDCCGIKSLLEGNATTPLVAKARASSNSFAKVVDKTDSKTKQLSQPQ